MLETVASQDGMALFDVDLDLVFQPEPLEKAVHRRDIVVILVFGGFLRFWLDQDCTLKADLVLVLHHHGQHASGLFGLAGQIGVEKSLIAFPPAPEDIVRASQLMGCVHAGLDGRAGIGKHVRVRIGGRTRHEATVRKEVRRAPEKLCLRAFHLGGKIIDDLFKIACRCDEILPLGADIGIVKAKERRAKNVEHLERDISLEPRQFHRLAEPRTIKGLAAKRIATLPREAVPIGDSKAQMVFHPFAHDHFIRVIMTERKLVRCFRPLVGDCRNTFEKVSHVSPFTAAWVARKR